MSSKICTIAACFVLVFVLSLICYNEASTSKMTVTIRLKQEEDPFVTLKSIMPPNTAMLEVREVNRQKNEYKITVKTQQQRMQFLECIRNNSRVEKVE